MSEEFGPWRPLELQELTTALGAAPFRWWITGGHALDLHVGHAWRDHGDIDFSVCREDTGLLFEHLGSWVPSIAAAGVLTPWDGRPLRADASENNVWWKQAEDGPWKVDTVISDGDAHRWRFRRDPTIAVPWAEAVLTTTAEVPYLAPELQLLFKAKDPRPKDHHDAEAVLEVLEPRRRAFLAAALPPHHPWQRLL